MIFIFIFISRIWVVLSLYCQVCVRWEDLESHSFLGDCVHPVSLKMGRGEQMSVVSISSSGKDFWGVMSKRKVVAMVAIFLPLMITSSYVFITTSDPSSEAMMLFQGRPFSSLLPLSVCHLNLPHGTFIS